MDAIASMKEELLRIQQAQAECIREDGFILSHKKYQYKELAGVADSLKRSIDWMTALYDSK